jgi:putative endonuclease
VTPPTYYLYILQSLALEKFYVGFSTDPWRRLEEHNSKEQKTFTSKFRPWKLVAVFRCPGDQSNIMQMEKFIKRQKSKIFIKGLIESQSPTSGILQKLVRVPHLRD